MQHKYRIIWTEYHEAEVWADNEDKACDYAFLEDREQTLKMSERGIKVVDLGCCESMDEFETCICECHKVDDMSRAHLESEV